MSRLPDDCFLPEANPLRLVDALALIADRTHPVVGHETIPIARAEGRVLARDVIARFDVPPHANAAVDGYGLRFADLPREGDCALALVARAAAGHPTPVALERGQASRIFTGAALPAGADTVIMQELVRLEGASVIVPSGTTLGANRRDAGEDLAKGARALEAGRRLLPQDIALAAAAGAATLDVARALRVALFSTGDELVEAGATPGSGQIFDANRPALASLLGAWGAAVQDGGILPDRPSAVRSALEAAAAGNDLIVTSAGVSVGEEDHVKAAVAALGHLHLWRLAIKPGRPVAMGQVGRVPFVGLPGNPGAALVTAFRLLRPLVLRLMGASATEPRLYKVEADFTFDKKPGRREWLKVRLDHAGHGLPRALRLPGQGSGNLSAFAAADGLVELGEDLTRIAPGTIVDFLPFSEVL